MKKLKKKIDQTGLAIAIAKIETYMELEEACGLKSYLLLDYLKNECSNDVYKLVEEELQVSRKRIREAFQRIGKDGNK